MMPIEIIFSLLLLILFCKQLHYALTLYQQEHYSNKKYIESLVNYYCFNNSVLISYGIFICTLLFCILKWQWILLATILLIALSFINIKRLIIPLKFTNRIKRMLVTIFLISIIILFPSVFWEFCFVLSLILLLIPFLIILTNVINSPIEERISQHFIKLAKEKLKKNNSLFKIAITGSYGKTSTKNIIVNLLTDDYLTLPTPLSYNTPLGIARTINEKLYANTEIFVVEMGAFRPLEIEYLTNFVQPQIGVLTSVGPQHLSTFKTIEGVLKTKMELLESKFSPNIFLVNGDNPYISNYLKQRKKDDEKIIISIGIDNEDVNYQAKEIKISKGKSCFSLYKDRKYLIDIKSRLLGKHNIYNLLISLATVLEMRRFGYVIPLQNLAKTIENIPYIPHRLAYQKLDKWDILDDSYNSNLFGFSYALEVLEMYPIKKIIITPGIVDAGEETKNINQTIANKIREVADEVFLVDNVASRFIQSSFQNNNFNNFQMFSDFNLAYKAVLKKYKTEEIVLLIENDLPDHFLRRIK